MRMRCEGHGGEGACGTIDGKHEGEGPLERPGQRWEKTLKKTLKKQDGKV